MLRTNSKFYQYLRWVITILLVVGGLTLGIQSIRSLDQAMILLEWTTASEIDIVGYNVLRGEVEEGPFAQINLQPIASSEDPFVGGEYVFEDRGVQAGKTYFYILEDVETSGLKNQHGPIAQKAERPSRMNFFVSGFLIFSAGMLAWNQAKKPAGYKDQGLRSPNDSSGTDYV